MHLQLQNALDEELPHIAVGDVLSQIGQVNSLAFEDVLGRFEVMFFHYFGGSLTGACCCCVGGFEGHLDFCVRF